MARKRPTVRDKAISRAQELTRDLAQFDRQIQGLLRLQSRAHRELAELHKTLARNGPFEASEPEGQES